VVTEHGTSEDGSTITELGRELLKYLHRRIEELGTNQASYRQARMELLRILESNRPKARFNWGFEAIFTQEIHTLEAMGLVAVKYGNSSIMAGRTSPNSIYNISLTIDGIDTARIIVERENRARVATAKVDDEGELEEDTQIDEPSDSDASSRALPGDRFTRSG
jgi:hypothetical protein